MADDENNVLSGRPDPRGRRAPATNTEDGHGGPFRRRDRSERMMTLRALTRAVLTLLAVLAPGAGWVTPAEAQDFVPSVVFDMGGQFDTSSNEAAYQGAESFNTESGSAHFEFA